MGVKVSKLLYAYDVIRYRTKHVQLFVYVTHPDPLETWTYVLDIWTPIPEKDIVVPPLIS